MTSPASASFPWSQVPEPPTGEFRRGSLPPGLGGDYLAARGSRPGPALLLLVEAAAGYAAIHGLFRLADVLDAQRLAGSLLIRVAGDGARADVGDLLQASDGLIAFQPLRRAWRELPVASFAQTDAVDRDNRTERMAIASGASYRYRLRVADLAGEPVGWMATHGRPSIQLRVPCRSTERPAAVEGVFQGLIDILRVFGMLEGQLSPAESRALQPPAYAEAPVAGYWTPSARPGQRLRIDDPLGSFRDGQGHELGNLLTNISGILLGISDEVRVELGQPLAELARPAE